MLAKFHIFIPVDSLTHVHLSVRVAGTVFRRTFEADPDLEFTYGWDKRNVFNQKHYGTTRARIAVG